MNNNFQQDDPIKPQSPFSLFWKWLAVFGVIGVLSLVALRMYGNSYVSNDTRDIIREWENTHVHLPAPWHQPAQLASDEAMDFHQNVAVTIGTLKQTYPDLLYGKDERSGLFGSYADPVLADDQRSTFSKLAADLQLLINEAQQVVDSPGYIFDKDFVLAGDAVSLPDYRLFVKLLLVLAKEQATAGDCGAAVETAGLGLRVLRRPEQASVNFHILSIDMAKLYAGNLYAVFSQCDDVQLVSNSLKMLNDLRSAVLTDIKNLQYSEFLGPLRYAAAYGYPVDLSPKSYADFKRQYISLYGAEYYHWVISNMPPGSIQVRRARIILEYIQRTEDFSYSAKTEARRFFRKPHVFKLATGYDLDMVRTAGIAPDYTEVDRRYAIASGVYDLARIELARRLVELNDDGTTISDYLSPVPNDPFTSGPFLYSQQIDSYYSVGPDKTDDKTAVKFDVLNGTMSKGDIWLER